MADAVKRRDEKGLDEERRQRGPELEESEHEGAAEEALAEDG